VALALSRQEAQHLPYLDGKHIAVLLEKVALLLALTLIGLVFIDRFSSIGFGRFESFRR